MNFANSNSNCNCNWKPINYPHFTEEPYSVKC